MATCGSCKKEGQTVEHIKECYAAKRGAVVTVEVTGLAKQYVEQKDFRPMALSLDIPAAYYALETPEGIKFFQVRIGKPGTKWDGFRFVDRLVGHPGDFQKYPVKGAPRKDFLALVAQDPKAHSLLFAKHFTVCGVCGSPLTDPESMALGLGPVCAGRF